MTSVCWRAAVCGLLLTMGTASHAQEADRKIDPTFLHRSIGAIREVAADITTASCRYKPMFGAGDADALPASGVALFGELVIDPKGSCKPASYVDEDQILVVLQGSGKLSYGAEQVALVKEDFVYVPATVGHALRNDGALPLTIAVIGYRTKGFRPRSLLTICETIRDFFREPLNNSDLQGPII